MVEVSVFVEKLVVIVERVAEVLVVDIVEVNEVTLEVVCEEVVVLSRQIRDRL